MLGPGDVLGINPNTIVRTEPRNWVTDFEPNYLAFIEFYEEDFVWRYTPARPVGDQLRPWLAPSPCSRKRPPTPTASHSQRADRLPLASITVRSTASLPPHTQTWAWAHVHTNEASTRHRVRAFPRIAADADHPNADRIICRLTSPRRLKPNTAYGAFVVPAFETGRLAGLGQDPKDVSAQHARVDRRVRSSGVARLLWIALPNRRERRLRVDGQATRAEAADPRVGIRDMDGEHPGGD